MAFFSSRFYRPCTWNLVVRKYDGHRKVFERLVEQVKAAPIYKLQASNKNLKYSQTLRFLLLKTLKLRKNGFKDVEKGNG